MAEDVAFLRLRPFYIPLLMENAVLLNPPQFLHPAVSGKTKKENNSWTQTIYREKLIGRL